MGDDQKSLEIGNYLKILLDEDEKTFRYVTLCNNLHIFVPISSYYCKEKLEEQILWIENYLPIFDC